VVQLNALKPVLSHDVHEPDVAGVASKCGVLVDEEVVFAAWLYHAGNLAVRVMYAQSREQRQGLDDAWHPKERCKRIPFSTF
jgi:hypothetical protein